MSSTNPASSSSSSGAKSAGSTYKPVYKLITFEDMTEFPTAAQRQRGVQTQTFKSWQSHQSTEQWMDKAMVEREIKEWPVSGGAGYIKAFMSMGKSRREILNNHLKTLNDTDKTADMVGMWEPECLFPGDTVMNKKTGQKVRSPTLFWVIIKRQKKVPEPPKSSSSGSGSSSSSSGGSSSAPKGVLKDDKKSFSGSKESDTNPLIRELLDAVTRLNTKDNLPDLQAQLQQVMFVLTKLLQKQEYQPSMPVAMPNQYPQMPVFQFQEQKLPTYSRLSLPPPPYNQFLPEDPQMQRMNPNVQPNMQSIIQPNMQPNMQQNMQSNMQQNMQQGMFPLNMQHDNSSRTRQTFDDNGQYSFNSHLNSTEPPNYPRGGIGSRRGSVSSLNSHFMGGQDEMMSQRQYEGGRGGGGCNVIDQGMQSRNLQMVPNHPNNQRPRSRSRPAQQGRHIVDSWQHDGSSSSGGSDEEYRTGHSNSRSNSREGSIYNLNHLRNSRPRSLNRGGDVDLSSGNRSRRNSVSFSDKNGGMMVNHGRMVNMNKGYGNDDSGSEDEINDQRMMMHGMSINRDHTRTPAPWPHPHRQ
ncbi:hypothetical protein EYR41_009483 [Orbilia oligospora]|uniref:Uncharacterized protein n=1 Tax=Orbilia oligospora TaxID=2813651 RepID=A0A7C8KAZ7_ORBOL|nr:hypothetical protein TWF751_010775 [Orbilia oligospora]TGJ65521.1 hypothetical protein EYR41_009483 [Orbilia oligospora]